jgi:hypothetical protein
MQRDIVRALAQRNCGFFLTGGGVLVEALGHRTTDDLDLFTIDDAAASCSAPTSRRVISSCRERLT